MNNSLSIIRQKIDAIHFAALRYYNNNEKATLHIRVKTDQEKILVCFTDADGVPPGIMNQNITIIQHSGNDYLYVTGIVCNEKGAGKNIFFVQLTKARWFVRKSKRSMSWLQQKYQYTFSGPEYTDGETVSINIKEASKNISSSMLTTLLYR